MWANGINSNRTAGRSHAHTPRRLYQKCPHHIGVSWQTIFLEVNYSECDLLQSTRKLS